MLCVLSLEILRVWQTWTEPRLVEELPLIVMHMHHKTLVKLKPARLEINHHETWYIIYRYILWLPFAQQTMKLGEIGSPMTDLSLDCSSGFQGWAVSAVITRSFAVDDEAEWPSWTTW